MDRRQLIQLLPYYDFGKGPIQVVYNYRKHLSSKVTTFTEALTRYLNEPSGH